jgi:thioredoxin reductase
MFASFTSLKYQRLFSFLDTRDILFYQPPVINHQTIAMSDRNYDAIILGAGPAGLSAALGFARVKRTALVLSKSTYRNEGIEAMHGVLGYDGAHPVSYRRIAQEQIENNGDGIHFRDGEAVRVGKIDLESTQGFQVQLRAGRVVKGKNPVLAVGSRDFSPNIDGYVENWPENM